MESFSIQFLERVHMSFIISGERLDLILKT